MRTQQELEAMTDFELAVIAAGYFLPCDYIINKEKEVVELANYKDVMNGGMHDQVLTAYAEYNPIKNWSDCGTLIDEARIDVLAWGSENSMVMGIGGVSSMQPSIKRAITIVYILIKQGE